MSDALNDDVQRRRPHAPPMAGPFLEFDLTREVGQLNAETGGAGGQTARTLVKLDDLRIVLITLTTGSRIPGHHRVESRSTSSAATSWYARKVGHSISTRGACSRSVKA